MLIVAFVVKLEQSRIIETKKFLLLQQLSTTQATLEGLITANLVVLRGLEAEIINRPQLNQQEFAKIAKILLSDDLQIRHIALAPDLVVRYIYPLRGNEAALGLDYKTHATQGKTVANAMKQRKINLAGPVNLVQGGQALIARLPIIQPDTQQPWGIVSAVIRLEQLLEESGVFALGRETQLALHGKDGTGLQGDLIWGDPQLPLTDAVSVHIQLPYGTWVMSARPAKGWQVATGEYINLLLAGITIALMLSVAVQSLLETYQERKEALKTSTYHANYDSLTGVCNRHFFHIKLDELIAECRREQSKFALLFIDLDHFKVINDNLGHATGDEFLRCIATRLQQNIRKTDIIARLAGDEFVVVMKSPANLEQLNAFAGKITRALSEQVSFDHHQLSASASIGVALYPDDGEDEDTLLKHADKAMYVAKQEGRNRFHLFNDELRREIEVHQHMRHEILHGLEHNEFRVFYQPIVSAGASKIVKCEALIRWQHPQKGLLSPIAFIPFAEQHGLIRQLDFWVLEQVCRDWHLFDRAGMPLTISVNRCSNEFATPQVDEQWLALIAGHQVPTDRIIFEITESLLMETNNQQLGTLKRLQQAGIKLAIDDFCTGYSALNFLRQYPTDFIKIDKCFVDELESNAQNQVLVEALLTMASALGIESIAEGIENRRQLEILRQLGCDYIQGYYIGKPMPVEELVALQQTQAPSAAINQGPTPG